MMRVGSLFLALASSAAAQVPPSLSTDADCPLAGPAFPAPSHLSNSTVFAGAIKGFQGQLNNKTLGLKPNDTAWAMAVFSAKENKTLYEDYYTPPIDVGVKKVDGDSIFRLASVSKVFTVWTVLTAIGDKHFNDPITKYIPELADAKPNTTAIYDDIDNVRWEDVTLGDLASQSAGIARDGKLI